MLHLLYEYHRTTLDLGPVLIMRALNAMNPKAAAFKSYPPALKILTLG